MKTLGYLLELLLDIAAIIFACICIIGFIGGDYYMTNLGFTLYTLSAVVIFMINLKDYRNSVFKCVGHMFCNGLNGVMNAVITLILCFLIAVVSGLFVIPRFTLLNAISLIESLKK